MRTASQMAKPVITVQLKIDLENLTVQVKWHNPECLEGKNQTNTECLGEKCMNFTSSNLGTAHTGICVSEVVITRPNSTDAGNQTNTVFLSGKCTNFTSSSLCRVCTGICVCRAFITRPNSTDAGNSTQAANLTPVTGTEDLTYANLKFEKKGIGSASSNVIYTEIKPLQQKQSGGDGSAACTEVDVSPKEEGKNVTVHCVASMVFRKSLVLDVLGGTCWPSREVLDQYSGFSLEQAPAV
ncbi:hypothetical protein EK904_013323, partial [Melospiza melodia maxima]